MMEKNQETAHNPAMDKNCVTGQDRTGIIPARVLLIPRKIGARIVQHWRHDPGAENGIFDGDRHHLKITAAHSYTAVVPVAGRFDAIDRIRLDGSITCQPDRKKPIRLFGDPDNSPNAAPGRQQRPGAANPDYGGVQ